MKVSLEGIKAFMGKSEPVKVETPLYDTITEEMVKPLMVNEDKEERTIEKVPFVSFGVLQHSSIVALDDMGALWILREGEEEWKQFPSPLRLANDFKDVLKRRMPQ